MKKLITILLLLITTVSFAQTYSNTGTANLQRAPTAKGYIYRNNMGALGNVQWYTQHQIDSLFTINGVNIYNTDGVITGNRLVNFGNHSLDFYSQKAGFTDLNFQPHSILATVTDSVTNDNLILTAANNIGGVINYNSTGTSGAELQVDGGTVSGQQYRAVVSVFSNNKEKSIILGQNTKGIAVKDSLNGLGLQGTRLFNYAIANGKTYIQKHPLDSVSKAKADSVKGTLSGVYVPTTRTLNNGLGIKPIGDLSVNRTITVDTTEIATKQLIRSVYSGDSYSDTNTGHVPAGDANNWPNQIINISPDIANSYQINAARSGTNSGQLLQIWATDIYPHRPVNRFEKVYLFVLTGSNDAAATPFVPVDTVVAHFASIYAMGKAAGFTVVAFTVPRTGIVQRDTNIVKYNAKLLSTVGLQYDYLVRPDMLLPDPTDTTYYKSDQLHWTTAGSLVIAQGITDVLKGQNNISPIKNGVYASTNSDNPVIGSTRGQLVVGDSWGAKNSVFTFKGRGGGLPATSGATPGGGIIGRFNDQSDMVGDMYGNLANGLYLQVTNRTDQSIHYPLNLQYNGGATNLGGAVSITPLSTNGIVKTTGSTGTLAIATAGTDYQAPLVSGVNIKTINSTSLLGSSNILLQTPLTAGVDYLTPSTAASTYMPFTGGSFTGNVLMTHPSTATNNYIGWFTGGVFKWAFGTSITATTDDFIFRNVNTSQNTLTLNTSTDAATFIGTLSASLPAYSSGTNLPVIYNSTNNRFETNANLALGSGATGVTQSINDQTSKLATTAFVWYNAGNIVAAPDITATTAATVISSYTPASNGSFRIGGYLNINSVTSDVAYFYVTYTDIHSTAITEYFYPQGATDYHLGVVGDYSLPTKDFRAKGGSAISVGVALSVSSGTINYDAGTTIQQLAR